MQPKSQKYVPFISPKCVVSSLARLHQESEGQPSDGAGFSPQVVLEYWTGRSRLLEQTELVPDTRTRPPEKFRPPARARDFPRTDRGLCLGCPSLIGQPEPAQKLNIFI
ncbi:hypothetical protein L484_021166 [Morus notabilis]|uniref:Uncharacterized protein n=1 Tax=Morus notabilis TaxID=981085 RepID=W9QQM3_9ROSA|nr:hypothetical protein L484_021166 [Morus notabilis]